MNVTDIAKKLVLQNSKTWLSEKLGISRVTLDTRLRENNWKKTEEQVLRLLGK